MNGDRTGPTRRLTWLPGVLFLVGAWLAASTLDTVLEFTPGDIIQWDDHAFGDLTTYRLVEHDGREAVHARCRDGAASGLYTAREVDLERTPVMEWSWRVDETLQGVDERTREGDDYAARVYVIVRHRILRWRTRAINYVWAGEQPAGADWPNAYNPRAHMVAVRSGTEPHVGRWHTERRNVGDDWRRFHDRETERLTHVAIMTDCDDAGRSLEAWYGSIRFLPDDRDAGLGIGPE
jgi:hypothetical protein